MTTVAYLEFRSKADRWLVLLLLAVSCLMVALGVLVLMNDSSDTITKVIFSLVTATSIPFLLWIFFGTRYRFTDTHLLVRSGPFHKDLLLESIIAVEPIRSFQSCHALSRDRFLIKYDTLATVMISPEDRGRFLQEMESRVPHLVWQDQKLVAYS